MKTEAVVVPRFGGPEVLTLRAVALPDVPRQGWVRLQVATAGVAYGDVMRRKGMPGMSPRRPFSPGYDVAGIVEAIGADVDPRWLGRRVAAMLPKVGVGGYARHVELPVEQLVGVPDAVPFDEAVCLGLNYITAYQLLHRLAAVKAGDWVLVHGAAGGVGSALLQLCRDAAVRAYGTASAGKHDLVRQLGGVPIDYRASDFVGHILSERDAGVAAVFDGIGGAHIRRSHKALEGSGTLVVYGLSGADGVPGALRTGAHLAWLKLRPDRTRVRFYAITVTRGARPADCRRDWEQLLRLRVAGRVCPVIGRQLPLEQASEAHRLLEARAVTGKIVLFARDAQG